MGMCKKCGDVFSSVEMTNGICNNCLKSNDTIEANSEAKNSVNESITNKKSDDILKVNAEVKNSINESIASKEVIITNIKMPFFSMVIFMVKWVIASIPAFIILVILGAIATGLLSGITGSMSRPY